MGSLLSGTAEGAETLNQLWDAAVAVEATGPRATLGIIIRFQSNSLH